MKSLFLVEQLFNGAARLGTETNYIYTQYQSTTSLLRYAVSKLPKGEYRISKFSQTDIHRGIYSEKPLAVILHEVE